MYKRFFHLAILLAFVASLLVITPVTPAAASDTSQGVSPEGLVNPDGRLNLDGSTSGALDLAGWTVQMDAQRGPVFSKTGASANTPTVGDWGNLGAGGAPLGYYVSAILTIGTDVYVAGGFQNAGGIPEADYVARWDGSAWHALGSNGNGDGSVTSNVYSLYYDGTNLYAGGQFSNVNNNGVVLTAADYIARWDGSNWSALGSDGASDGSLKGGVVRVIIGNGSYLYVGGAFQDVNDSGTVLTEADRLAGWNGTNWEVVGQTGSGNGALNKFVYALALDGSTLYVGGTFTDAAGIPEADAVAAWDGSTWSALGSNGASDGAFDSVTDSVFALALNSTGQLYVGGYFTDVNKGLTNMPDADHLVKWDGSNWSAVGTNGTNAAFNGQVQVITIDASDNVYVGGYFTNVTNNGTSIPTADRIAKWDGSNWSALGDNGAGDGSINRPTLPTPAVFALRLDGSKLYVGGYFEDVNNAGTPLPFADHLIVWNVNHWEALTAAPNGAISAYSTGTQVYAVAVIGTDVYVGGIFNDVSDSQGLNIAAADNIARWDGTQWYALGNGASGYVATLFVDGTDLYAGGGFQNMGGVATADYVAKWNGSAWSGVGNNGAGNGSITTIVNAIAKYNGDLYIGGQFTNPVNVDGTVLGDADYLARWNGSNWSAVVPAGTPLLNPVYALKSVPSGLYVGGSFSDAGGVATADFVARWDGSNWYSLGVQGIGGPVHGIVYAIDVIGTDVYVGGDFLNTNGIPQADFVSRWDGSTWHALGSNAAGTDGSLALPVRALAHAGNALFAGGDFTNVSDASGPLPAADYVARWDGSHWFALGSNGAGSGSLNQMVNALTVADALYVGGKFLNVNNNGAPLPTADYIASYGIDLAPPTVLSVTRGNPDPTAEMEVAFTVIFSKPVTSLDTSDFSLVQAGGVSGATVTKVSGGNDTYSVTVDTGLGSGTLRLDLPAGATISDLYGNPLAGLPYASGETYTVNKVAPGLLLPVNTANLPIVRPSFDWTDFAGAGSYTIQVSKNSAFPSNGLLINKNVATSNYAHTANLAANTLMYWRVRAKVGKTYTPWSAVWSFTTGNPPSVPTLSAPASNAMVGGPSPLFDWKDSTVGNGAVFDHYQIQIGTDIAFNNIVHDHNVTGSAANSSDNTAVLNPAATYYWRVRSFAADGDYSAWSKIFSVRIKLVAPTLLIPLDLALGVALNPTFTWNVVVGATGYNIQISKSLSFGAGTITGNPVSTNFTPSGNLQATTVYYWRVRATGGSYGPSDWSVVFSFTTQ